MQIAPHQPAQVLLSVWRNAPFEVSFRLTAGTPPAALDLSSVIVGLTMTGLAGGESLTLRSDAPGPQTVADDGSYLQITNAAEGQVTLLLGAADAERVHVGRLARWRLWLALDGGEVPLIYGCVEGRDCA